MTGIRKLYVSGVAMDGFAKNEQVILKLMLWCAVHTHEYNDIRTKQ